MHAAGTGTALEAVLKRDRRIVIAALVALAALAWAYTWWLASGMGMAAGDMAGMDMGADGMAAMMPAAARPWGIADAGIALAMWTVMMVGMMTPSVAPMVLLYARVGRQAARNNRPIAATGWFAAGYFLAWLVFSVVATFAQWLLERFAQYTPMMSGADELVGGIVLLAVGVYQWTPLKYACLAQCQAPLTFIQRHGGFARTASGSLRLGARHGAYCVGCCWALMTLLFVGGVMNLLWIAAIAIVVLLEKILPGGRLISRLAGLVAIAAGVRLLVATSG